MEKREGYKKTKLGWIPEEWKVKQLGDGQLIKKITQGPNPNYKIGVPSISFRALKTKDLYDHKVEYSKADKISSETFQACEKSELIDKDILVAIVGRGSIGKSNMFRKQNGIRYIYTRALGLIRVNKDTIQPDFLNQYFQSYRAKNYFDRGIGGSTGQEVLQTSTLKIMPIPLPPLPEQQKIAEILTTVDDKISSIESQIQQTEELKKGLMEKLLTEGIGHTEFKDTKIGRIPASWDVVQVRDIGKVITGNTPKTSNKKFYDNGVRLWASPADLGSSKYIKETIKRLSLSGFEQTRKLPKNSLLITCIGSTIGKIGIASQEMSSNQQINAIVCKLEKYYFDFYYYILLSISSKIKQMSSTHAVPILNKKTFSNIFVPMASFLEQKQIASILSTVDDKLEILQSKKSSYETLKKGLMEQLLTGERRVKL